MYFYLTIFELVGLPLALIRMWEPYVKDSFKKDFLRCICTKNKKMSKQKFKSMSLNLFLNSAINIELVFIILSHITHFL